VARGDTHLTVLARGSSWSVRYTDRKKVNRHCPSVDVLFDSAADAVGDSAIGVLLTGMGSDGAAGLLRLRQCGALTLAQDARSCVVFGMPKAAQSLGAADIVGPPEKLPRLMLEALATRRRQTAPSR
jgi:two-component system chemotaxis response regulator CheB